MLVTNTRKHVAFQEVKTVKICFKRDWWFWCRFVPNLLQYVRANNYFTTKRFDKVIAKRKRCSFFCHTVYIGIILVYSTTQHADFLLRDISSYLCLKIHKGQGYMSPKSEHFYDSPWQVGLIDFSFQLVGFLLFAWRHNRQTQDYL